MQKKPLFSLTPVQVNQFARENLKAMMFLTIATQDYIAARCCLINGLFSGLVLSAQAVEKYLKAYYLFLVPSKNTRKISHKVQDLAAEISSLDPRLKLSPHRELIMRLEAHYQTRYPDNPGASTSQSTGEIHGIDALVILINQQMPIPLELKLRSGLYSRLFHGKTCGYDSNWNDEYWLLKDNQALSVELQEIVDSCNALERFLENLRYNSPDSFLNGSTRLSGLTVPGSSYFFKVSFAPNFDNKILSTVESGFEAQNLLKFCPEH